MNAELYRRKVRGAWVGKAVGGTLGQPWEGCRGPLALTFYDPLPQGALPNDDLDLQVLWACKLAGEWSGVLDRRLLGQAWQECVGFPYDEYGVAVRNLKMGIPAPWSGRYDNCFGDGMGAAIRSELWACLAPGEPELAARYAEEDGCVDHYGDGLAAIRFLSALQSMAFGSGDYGDLVRKALPFIPAESPLRRTIETTVNWCGSEAPDDVFRLIRQHYVCANFTDVKANLACVVAALLLGGGDFGRSLCLAVNFGEDADCTAATVGATMGIVAPEAIPSVWLAPVGENVVLSKEVTGITPPRTLDELTGLVAGLRGKIRLADAPLPPEPDWQRYAIACRRAVFHPWFAGDPGKFNPQPVPGADEFRLPGNFCEVDIDVLPVNAMLLLEIPFVCPQRRKVRLLVNTTANMRVWVDGTYLFGREGGDLVPAFHRPPLNQYADLELEQGEHLLVVGLAPVNDTMHKVPLLFGFAGLDKNWLTDMFVPLP